MAKRLRRPVVATDIDPVAVRTAAVNARLNGVGAFVRPLRAAGMQHRAIPAGAPYDLIVANILAGPLCVMAPSLVRAAAPGASIVLSGILTTQAARVTAAYRAQSAVLRTRIIKGEWATLLLERPC
jgi:ribosomal protein L11 methyltransferase